MRQILGLDIGGTRIKLAVFSTTGELLSRVARPSRAATKDGVPAFALTARALVARLAAAKDLVALAAPGVVAPDGRSISFQPGKLPGIEGFNWTDFLRRDTPVPVINDAHAALLGELWQGAARGCRHAILLTLGTGVGGAVWSDGRLLKGAIGRAGHLGHISINASARRGIFGTPGALELAIGDCTLHARGGGRFETTRLLVKSVNQGDKQARKIWIASVRALARAIVSFINCFDPEKVVIGGGIAAAGPTLFTPLKQFLDDWEWRPGGHRVEVVPAALGEWAGTYGAAWNALRSA